MDGICGRLPRGIRSGLRGWMVQDGCSGPSGWWMGGNADNANGAATAAAFTLELDQMRGP